MAGCAGTPPYCCCGGGLDDEDLGRGVFLAAPGALTRLGVEAWVICWEAGRGLVLSPPELEPQLSQQPQQPQGRDRPG